MAKLIILSGPMKGLEYLLEQEAIIGRQSSNTIPLEDSKSSRQHSRVFSKNDGYYLEDMGSRNGTLLNGNLLEKPCRLKNDDKFQVGATLLVFEDGSELRKVSKESQENQETLRLDSPPDSSSHPSMTTLDELLKEKNVSSEEEIASQVGKDDAQRTEKQKVGEYDHIKSSQLDAKQESKAEKKSGHVLQEKKTSPQDEAAPQDFLEDVIQIRETRKGLKNKTLQNKSKKRNPVWDYISIDFSDCHPLYKCAIGVFVVLFMVFMVWAARWLTLQILS